MTDSRTIAIRLLDAVGARDYDTARKLLDPAVTFTTPFGNGAGPEFIIQMNEMFVAAMPDLTHTVTDSVAEGDTAAWELTFTGTHTGALRTPAGELPPTGRRISFDSCDYVKVDGDRVVSWHIHMDATAALAQLGGK